MATDDLSQIKEQLQNLTEKVEQIENGENVPDDPYPTMGKHELIDWIDTLLGSDVADYYYNGGIKREGVVELLKKIDPDVSNSPVAQAVEEAD